MLSHPGEDGYSASVVYRNNLTRTIVARRARERTRRLTGHVVERRCRALRARHCPTSTELPSRTRQSGAITTTGARTLIASRTNSHCAIRGPNRAEVSCTENTRSYHYQAEPTNKIRK